MSICSSDHYLYYTCAHSLHERCGGHLFHPFYCNYLPGIWVSIFRPRFSNSCPADHQGLLVCAYHFGNNIFGEDLKPFLSYRQADCIGSEAGKWEGKNSSAVALKLSNHWWQFPKRAGSTEEKYPGERWRSICVEGRAEEEGLRVWRKPVDLGSRGPPRYPPGGPFHQWYS